jgi:uncharacterized protein involved in type VI secretion and phage assembly
MVDGASANGSNGLVIGVVCDLDDPDRLGRVRVRYPHLNDQESDWMRTVNVMAGAGRGAFFRPEPEDEVMIAWEHGDPRRPHLLGGLWSQTDSPPADDGKPTENNWRFITSRSGHLIKLDDTENSERIEIVGMDTKRRIVIDCSAKSKKIQIICDEGDLELSAPQGTVKIDAKDVVVTATGKMDLTAKGGPTTVKGQTVDLNP